MLDTNLLLGGSAGLSVVSAALLARHWLRPLQAAAIPVLRYRFVGPPLPGSPFNPLRLSLPGLSQHLNYLRRRRFRLVTLSEAWAKADSANFLASRPVVLTFDGGYKSFIQLVAPRIVECGIGPATVFVASDAVGKDNSYEIGVQGRAEPMMDEQDLRSLAAAGFEVGSLGCRGRDLSQLSHQDLVADLRDSRQRLSEITGREVRALAFARDANASHFATLIKQAGYSHASWISLDGLMNRGSEPYRLPRFPMTRKSQVIELALVLAQRMA
jgi:peptidoglycan/xylan/chitin deacetylase (PgdA/CDA1 family)